jgi:hypothetical protein
MAGGADRSAGRRIRSASPARAGSSAPCDARTSFVNRVSLFSAALSCRTPSERARSPTSSARSTRTQKPQSSAPTAPNQTGEMGTPPSARGRRARVKRADGNCKETARGDVDFLQTGGAPRRRSMRAVAVAVGTAASEMGPGATRAVARSSRRPRPWVARPTAARGRTARHPRQSPGAPALPRARARSETGRRGYSPVARGSSAPFYG